MQLTVRMPDEYTKKLNVLSKKMGLKRSDVVRLALQRFFDENREGIDQSPFEKVKSMLGVAESGIKDLGQRHRHHLIQKMRRGS
ncbi:MAG: ribbon-helix-helix protein, CopG family [Deltaproteobacteria bacterium]|jgi:metal-responsive CopG/Arc/MetJ family transcriptional regulator|nr:ribbon-helix-helix protein, CopG family [Deltaproteobacteria bacterium]